MVFIKPDIEAGTIQDQADLATPAQYPEPDTDEEPDVEEIEVRLTQQITIISLYPSCEI